MAAKRASARPARRPARKEERSRTDRLPDVLRGVADAMSAKSDTMEVLRLSDDAVTGHVTQLCSTRSIAIDRATGGGLPFKRLVEVFGPEQCGKTTLLDHVFAQTQAMGGAAAVYDAEEKKDRGYAQAIGVDIAALLAIQPEAKTVESGVGALCTALDYWIAHGYAGRIPLTVGWDSVAATPVQEELDNPGTQQPGMAAREWRKALRLMTGKIARAGALVVLINQQYEKIGGPPSFGAGPRKSTYGGGGPRYHASLRLELVRTGALKDVRGNPCGVECLVKVAKGSVNLGERPATDEKFAVQYGRGINNAWSILERLKGSGHITSGGGWYQYAVQGQEPVRWQGGWQGLTELLNQHADLMRAMAAVYMAVP